nr:terminase [Tiger shark herpes-like virus]
MLLLEMTTHVRLDLGVERANVVRRTYSLACVIDVAFTFSLFSAGVALDSFAQQRVCAHRLARNNTVFQFLFQTARGQNPDLTVVDEAAFINLPALLAVIPLMAITGTKQIHTSSPVENTSWISKVYQLKDKDGKPAVHVISYQFKCQFHAMLTPDFSCSCCDIYCPDHISIDEFLQQLLNLIHPGSFEMELTGATMQVGDNIKPFYGGTFKTFLVNTVDTTTSKFADAIDSFYISVDPTFGNGRQSGIGICTLVKTHFTPTNLLVSAR